MPRRLNRRDKALLAELDRARAFPVNTCSASRHTEMIGEALLRGQPYPMITEEPEHVGESLLATVAALYAARTRVKELEDATQLEQAPLC